MKTIYLYKVKNFLWEVWRDFKNPQYYHNSNSSCCGFEPNNDSTHMRPRPIRVNTTDNNIKNFKK